MIRLGRLCCIAMAAVVLLAAGGEAQVDWGPLLGEKGSQPNVEAPQHPAVPTPTMVPRPLTRDTGHGRATPMRARRSATPRPRRHVPRLDAGDEREYPAAPSGRQH
jgi:hypothetical protein